MMLNKVRKKESHRTEGKLGEYGDVKSTGNVRRGVRVIWREGLERGRQRRLAKPCWDFLEERFDLHMPETKKS